MKSKILFSVGTIGVLFMMAGQLSFSINDSYVKLVVKNIGDDNSLYSVIFLRGLVTSSLLGLYLIFFEKKNLIKILSIKSFHIRGLYEVLTALFFLVGLILLPISEVYTLLMTNPFFVTIFAFLFLREKVGIRRWCAVFIGFLGVLVVVNPQNFQFNYLLVLPILAAIFLTIRDIATKSLATKSNSVEITFVTALLITGFAGLGSIIFGYQVSGEDVNYILASSIFVLFGYLFSVLTVFYAPLSLTASARYSVIIFGMIFGYLILGETPTYNMIVGAIIITLSGLFVIKREKEIGKIK